jgi:hypothetical protein
MHTPPDPDALAARLAATLPVLPGFEELRFDHLSAAGRIDALVACVRLCRRAEALLVYALSAQERAARAEAWGASEAEVTAATRWPVGTVKNRLAEAAWLTGRFPETLAALERGEVSGRQAKALVAATTCLGDEAARVVQERVLSLMPGQSQASTRQALRRAVIAADPDGEARRHVEAKKLRRVQVCPELDGMATLSVHTTADTARAMLGALDTRCRRRAKGDSRTLDQRRADALASLVLDGERRTTSPGPEVSAVVRVVVNIETLLGVSDAPAHLEGYGAISAVQARALAVGRRSVLRRMIVDPAGAVVQVDARSYRLSAAERRYILARDRHCDFPGCQMPGRLCDMDHETPFARGGRTDRSNMCPRCRRHHNLKTHGYFECEHEDAAAIWTSVASGRSYTSTPEPYWVITEDDIREWIGE